MTATLFTSPLDVVKTRLQSTFYNGRTSSTNGNTNNLIRHPAISPRSALLHMKDTFSILASITRNEGWATLFRGLTPNLAGFVPASAIKFFVYGNSKELLAARFNSGKQNSWIHFGAAATAGLVTSTATNPFWVIKTRLQLDRLQDGKTGQARRYQGSIDCIRQTLRQEGIRGFYRGLAASYLGIAESALQWVLYERLKTLPVAATDDSQTQLLSSTGSSGILQSSSEAAAAGFSKLVAAVLRTRLREAPQHQSTSSRIGLWTCLRTIVQQEGLGALYGGLTPHLLRVVPSAAIMFSVYEATLRIMAQ
ncbi:hypothetical protein FH972_022773 [Carpinus fangiana]|uniref:Uncharacterized protein n=1 Tax=Carpinus fangiana TaxID=176857 RepID=A0A5N6KVF8_9ROSI|nr:hypothetical protein FH972_022773 [Carpinus fangiana]